VNEFVLTEKHFTRNSQTARWKWQSDETGNL